MPPYIAPLYAASFIDKNRGEVSPLVKNGAAGSCYIVHATRLLEWLPLCVCGAVRRSAGSLSSVGFAGLASVA